MNYIVLDLETANPDYASICQVGMVVVRDGQVVDQISQYIDPDDYFDEWNVEIHGITKKKVRGSPLFSEYHSQLQGQIEDSIVVTHGSFDRIAIQRACARYEVEPIGARWLDNQRVVRRTWKEFSRKGYALKKLAKHFEIEFSHHDALEDARAAEQIFRLALEASGHSPQEWLGLVSRTLDLEFKKPISREGVETGEFHGEQIVFTGAMRVPRREAADMAQKEGFDVGSSVSKKTTILCVGLLDKDRLNGYDKSSKQRKAEKMISAGAHIEIVSEEDFWELIKPVSES